VPLYAGFGIGTPAQAAEAVRLCDGIVIGSRAVEIGQSEGPDGLREFVAALRAAADATGNG
jgi:tryptophan synthase alpha chain